MFLSAKRKKILLLGSSTLFLEKQKCVDIITITFHHSSVLLRENRDNLFSKPLGNMIYIPNFRKHTTSIKKVIFHTFPLWKYERKFQTSTKKRVRKLFGLLLNIYDVHQNHFPLPLINWNGMDILEPYWIWLIYLTKSLQWQSYLFPKPTF